MEQVPRFSKVKCCLNLAIKTEQTTELRMDLFVDGEALKVLLTGCCFESFDLFARNTCPAFGTTMEVGRVPGVSNLKPNKVEL